jgi:hypothetical protein
MVGFEPLIKGGRDRANRNASLVRNADFPAVNRHHAVFGVVFQPIKGQQKDHRMNLEAIGDLFQIHSQIAHQPLDDGAPEPVFIGQRNAAMDARLPRRRLL